MDILSDKQTKSQIGKHGHGEERETLREKLNFSDSSTYGHCQSKNSYDATK